MPSTLLTGLAFFAKLDEVSGTRADSSGNGNTLADPTSVGSAPGKIGLAASFVAASTQILSATSNSGLQRGGKSWSAVGWYKHATGSSSYVMQKGNSFGNFEFSVKTVFTGTNNRMGFYVLGPFGDQDVVFATDSGDPDTNWHFFAVWVDLTVPEIGIQVDGKTRYTVPLTVSPASGTSPLEIGCAGGNSPNYMDGLLGLIGIWDRVLTTQEFSDLHNYVRGLSYPFDGTYLPTHGYIAKPPAGSRLNRADPLAKSLKAAWLYQDGNGSTKVRDRVNGGGVYDFTIPAADYSFTSGIDGPCIDHAALQNTNQLTLANAISSGTTFSVAVRLKIRTKIAWSSYASVLTFGDAAGLFLMHPSTSQAKIDYYTGGSHIGATLFDHEVWYDIVVSVAAGVMTYYVNGVTDANTFSGVGAVTYTTSMDDNSTEGLDGQIAFLAVWIGRALTQQDAASLHADPYRMWRHRYLPVPLYVTAGGGGNQTASPGIVTITTSIVSPSLVLGGVSVTTGVGAVTVSGANPALTAIYTAVSGQVVVSITGVSPALVLSPVLLASGTPIVTVSGVDPVLTGGAVSRVSGTAVVTVSAVTPTTVVGSVSLTSVSALVTTTVSDPSLTATNTLSAGSVSVTTTVVNPTTAVGQTTTTPSTAVVTVTTISPTVSGGNTSVVPGVVLVSVTVSNPGLLSLYTTAAGVGTITVELVAPDLVVGEATAVAGVVVITTIVVSPTPRVPDTTPSTPGGTWKRPYWQVIRVFSGRLFVPGVPTGFSATSHQYQKDGAVAGRSFRVWRYNNMALAKETLYKFTDENKTYAADFSNEGAIRSGETIVSGTVSVSPTTGTPPTPGDVEVITEKFYDSDGKVIQPYKGLKCRLSGGDASTRTVVFLGVTSGGDELAVPGKLVIEDPTT